MVIISDTDSIIFGTSVSRMHYSNLIITSYSLIIRKQETAMPLNHITFNLHWPQIQRPCSSAMQKRGHCWNIKSKLIEVFLNQYALQHRPKSVLTFLMILCVRHYQIFKKAWRHGIEVVHILNSWASMISFKLCLLKTQNLEILVWSNQMIKFFSAEQLSSLVRSAVYFYICAAVLYFRGRNADHTPTFRQPQVSLTWTLT